MTAKIFLSYAHDNEVEVEKLYDMLSERGFNPWMAKRDIFPGEKWKLTIQKALRSSDFFLACLSNKSVNRRGYVQVEIREALELLQEKLENDIYLIPVVTGQNN